MLQSPVDYLRHILDECEYISSVIPDSFTKEQLLDDETLKRAVVRSLEIIGEATQKIPADIKIEWSEVQWKNIAGMRDKLIHDYFGINYSIVWDVVKNKIPDLTETVRQILAKEKNQ
ncbi:MAG: DUF86 domain-containing protein [Bacteroidetes bacterium]|nr:DUF86 domain-containing protein [Bacteroidota bacterium]